MNEDLDKDLDKIKLISAIDVTQINMVFIQKFRDSEYNDWKNIYDASFSGNCFTLNEIDLGKLLHNHGFLFTLDQMRLYNIATYYSSICFFILLKNHNCHYSINKNKLIYSDLSCILNDKLAAVILNKNPDTNYENLFNNIIIGNFYNIYNNIDNDYKELNLLSCYNLYFKVIIEKIIKIFKKNANDIFLKDNSKLIDIINIIYWKNDLYIKVLYNFIIYKYFFNEKKKYEHDQELIAQLKKILKKINANIKIHYKNIPALIKLSKKYYEIFMLKYKDKLLEINEGNDLIKSNDKLFSEYESYYKLILSYYENKGSIYQMIIDSDYKHNRSFFNKLLLKKLKENEHVNIKLNNYKKDLLNIYPVF